MNYEWLNLLDRGYVGSHNGATRLMSQSWLHGLLSGDRVLISKRRSCVDPRFDFTINFGAAVVYRSQSGDHLSISERRLCVNPIVDLRADPVTDPGTNLRAEIVC